MVAADDECVAELQVHEDTNRSLSVRQCCVLGVLVAPLVAVVVVLFTGLLPIIWRLVLYISQTASYSRTHTTDLICDHFPCNDFSISPQVAPDNPCLTDTDLFLLILVKSHPLRFDARETIRNTWGQPLRYRDYAIRTMFILNSGASSYDLTGTTMGSPISVAAESEEFADIIDINTPRSVNATELAILALKWLVQNCSQTDYILVTDDSALVFPWNLLENFLLTSSPDTLPNPGFTASRAPWSRTPHIPLEKLNLESRESKGESLSVQSPDPDAVHWLHSNPGPDMLAADCSCCMTGTDPGEPSAEAPTEYRSCPSVYLLSQTSANKVVQFASFVAYSPSDCHFVLEHCGRPLDISCTPLPLLAQYETSTSTCDIIQWVSILDQAPPEVMTRLWRQSRDQAVWEECLRYQGTGPFWSLMLTAVFIVIPLSLICWAVHRTSPALTKML